MIKRRGISRRAAAVAAIATVGVAGSMAGQAFAQPSAGALTTSKGGYRDVASNTGTGYAKGLPGAVMEASTSSAFGTTTPFPPTDANGETSLGGLVDNQTYYVREKTSPAGWEKLETLDWNGSDQPYVGSRRYESDEVKAVRIDDNTHRFVNRLANPALPATCGVGIKVLLLLDTSGSTSGFNDQYNAAAKAFINTLGGTPTQLKISSFATTSSPGNTMFDLSTAGGQTDAADAVDAIYPNNTSGSGSTNWDAALQDAAAADVDVIVFVTDGNPTVNQGDLGTGGNTSIEDVTFGVASANLAKNPSMDGGKKQTMMAVGVGGNLAVDNLKAVSGPNEGSDWTTAEDPSDLAAALKKIAEAICPADLAIEKTGDATVEPDGTISYELTVTNKGTGDIPFESIVVKDPDVILSPPDPAPKALGPGESAVWMAKRSADGAACGAELSNTGTVDLDLPGYEEQDLKNNESTWITRVICPLDVSIAKTSTNSPVEPGGTATYDVVVTNSGKYPVPFKDIMVDDPGADLTPPDPEPESLAPGESATWKASREVPVDQECGSQVENTASVSLGNGVPDDIAVAGAVSNGTSATAYADVICPVQVSIAKSTGQATVEPGGSVTYDVTVTNSGKYPVPFSSIVVTDAGSTLTPPADTSDLAPGASRSWTATVAVAADAALCGTSVLNTADVALSELESGLVDVNEGTTSSATASGVLVTGGICTPVTPATTPAEPVTAFRPATTPTLTVRKTGQRRAIAGGRVVFRVTVTNTGATTATNVVLRDTPARAMLWRVVPRRAKISRRTATWNLGDLAPGQSVSAIVKMRMRVTARGRSCNTAIATATDLGAVRARACVTVTAARRPATPVTG